MKKQSRWVNFYPPCDTTGLHPWRTTSWMSKALADANAKPGRVACVKVDFKLGDGCDDARAKEKEAG